MHLHVPVLGFPFLGPRQVQPNSTSRASSSRLMSSILTSTRATSSIVSSSSRSPSVFSTTALPTASFRSTTTARVSSAISSPTSWQSSDVEASTIVVTVEPTYVVTENPLPTQTESNSPSAPATTVIEESSLIPPEPTSSEEEIPTSTFTLDVTPSFVHPTPVVLPTLTPCRDGLFIDISPQAWVAAGVDETLRSVQHEWMNGGSFIDYIGNLTGQHSLQCGIGKDASCPTVDCNAFMAAGGQPWVYHVSASILQLNTFINQVYDGIVSGKADLALVLPKMTKNFFEFHPKPTKTPIWPWIGAALGAVLAFIPALLPLSMAGIGAGIGGSAAAFVAGGLTSIQSGSSDPHSFFLGTMEDLGGILVDLSSNTTEALDAWTRTLFEGKPDSTGKTILDYFAGGRFAMQYNLTGPQMAKHYFQGVVAKVIDDQWKSVNASNRNFVMCATEDVPCKDRSRFVQDGMTCCFYSLKKNGKYTTPIALDALEKSPFDIKASDIVAGSLHTFLSNAYNQTAEERIQESFTEDNTTQAFNQGVTFPGTFTLPVCNVGSNGAWVADKDSALLPCDCGSMTQTNDFINAAHLAKFGNYCDKCEKQSPGFVCPKTSDSWRGFKMDGGIVWGVGLVWAAWLFAC